MSNIRSTNPPSEPKQRENVPCGQQDIGVSSYERVWQSLALLFRPRFWYALRLAIRSGYGNMKTLLSKKHWAVDLGLHFERLECGCLVPNERTSARNNGMKDLEASYPWANTVLVQMFLDGFDKGEQYILGKMDRSGRVSVESSVTSKLCDKHRASAL